VRLREQHIVVNSIRSSCTRTGGERRAVKMQEQVQFSKDLGIAGGALALFVCIRRSWR
jgi:hypothetical protein